MYDTNWAGGMIIIDVTIVIVIIIIILTQSSDTAKGRSL
jgi:hypothetical protein